MEKGCLWILAIIGILFILGGSGFALLIVMISLFIELVISATPIIVIILVMVFIIKLLD